MTFDLATSNLKEVIYLSWPILTSSLMISTILKLLIGNHLVYRRDIPIDRGKATYPHYTTPCSFVATNTTPTAITTTTTTTTTTTITTTTTTITTTTATASEVVATAGEAVAAVVVATAKVTAKIVAARGEWAAAATTTAVYSYRNVSNVQLFDFFYSYCFGHSVIGLLSFNIITNIKRNMISI